MDNYKLSEIMLSKIKPDFNNKDWLKAVELMRKLNKKNVVDRPFKEADFCYYVDKIYKDLEVKNGKDLS